MATTSASADAHHIRKRQYQPSITSYFNRGEGRLQASRSPLSPPLDAATQASLLSVGMRVRKSVPEGYKTHKAIGVDGFPFPSTAPATSAAPPRPTYSNTSSRELMPFCGLHKIGGLSSQPYVPSSSAPAIMGLQDEDSEEMPGFTTSQRTLPSTQGSFTSFASPVVFTGTKKRTFEEEIEDDMDAFFFEVDMAQPIMADRRIARPKASLRRAPSDVAMLAAGGEDFEDAAFLSPMDEDE